MILRAYAGALVFLAEALIIGINLLSLIRI
jgi:hypothetical protein